MFTTSELSRVFLAEVVSVLLLGAFLGILVFNGIPWIYHHIVITVIPS